MHKFITYLLSTYLPEAYNYMSGNLTKHLQGLLDGLGLVGNSFIGQRDKQVFIVKMQLML